MRFVRFIPHGRFHDSKPRAMPLDLTTIGFGFLAVVVVIVIVALVMPTVFHSWDRYPRPVEYFYPAYPQHELEQGIGGDVTVRFTINRLGEVASFQVLDDGGSDALAMAVRESDTGYPYWEQAVDGLSVHRPPYGHTKGKCCLPPRGIQRAG